MDYKEKTIEDFLNELGSKAPVPGGGGASALVGAIGISLGNMVGELTVGKEKYKAHEEEMKTLMEEGLKLKEEFLSLIDEDAKAFEPLSYCYKMDKNDPEREEKMEACLIQAAAVPLKILELSTRCIEMFQGFAEFGSKLAISDAATGVIFAWAAMYGAAINVKVNTGLMKDRKKAEETDQYVKDLMNRYYPVAEKIYEEVYGRL